MFNYTPQQHKPAMPTRRQTIMPSYGQQSTPQLGRQQQFAGPPSGGMIPRIPIGMAGSNVLAMGVPGSVTDPQITAELQRRDAMDGREKTQRVIGLIDQNSANQRDVQDMRRVIGGVPGAQTPQGYAAPLSNNGSQVADYTGSMGAFRTDEQRRADRDMANQAMRWQANREADMMSGDLRQRMQRAYGGGDIPVGPPQTRTDGTVMVGNRFMEVPPNMIPVENRMATPERYQGMSYGDRVQQRAQQRLAAQGFTSEVDQNTEMARRRASYMADVNGNSERSRQMRRAERMGLIPRGSRNEGQSSVSRSSTNGDMIPIAKKERQKEYEEFVPAGVPEGASQEEVQAAKDKQYEAKVRKEWEVGGEDTLRGIDDSTLDRWIDNAETGWYPISDFLLEHAPWLMDIATRQRKEWLDALKKDRDRRKGGNKKEGEKESNSENLTADEKFWRHRPPATSGYSRPQIPKAF